MPGAGGKKKICLLWAVALSFACNICPLRLRVKITLPRLPQAKRLDLGRRLAPGQLLAQQGNSERVKIIKNKRWKLAQSACLTQPSISQYFKKPLSIQNCPSSTLFSLASTIWHFKIKIVVLVLLTHMMCIFLLSRFGMKSWPCAVSLCYAGGQSS